MPVRNQTTSLGGLPIQIDYTARDFDAIRAEMLTLANRLTPEWTDREPGDIGVTLVEAMAYVSDILSYQIDRVQNESYLASAQTRESVVDILRLIGYELSPASPATVGMVVRTDQDNVTLPKGFTVRTQANAQTSALQYQLTEAVNLPLAGLYCVSYEQSKVSRIFNENSVTNDSLIFVAGRQVVEGVGVSDGTQNQTFLLSKSPVCLSADGLANISVTVNGDVYEARTSFIGADPNDLIFTYKFLSTEEVIITFGDGVNGFVPTNNGTIIASYRIDGGQVTNRAGVGSIDKFDTIEGLVSVYNVSQPSGGSDPEDLLTAKRNGPLSIRALDRCVTLEDFETMARLTPGGAIRSARAVEGDSPLTVDVYIATEGDNPVPSGRWFPSLQNGYGLIGSVGRWLSQKKPVPTKLNILAPTAVNPYFEATVFVYPNLLRQTVEFDVDLSLQSLFNEITSDFGESVPLSAIMQAIENTRGVDYVDVVSSHRLPSIRFVSGNESAFDGSNLSITELNEQTVKNKYYVEWLNASEYQLRINDLLIVDESGNSRTFSAAQSFLISLYNDITDQNEAARLDQFKIIIDIGPVPPNAQDRWVFSVDDYLGNIEAEDYEIIVAPIQNDGRISQEQFVLTFTGGI